MWIDDLSKKEAEKKIINLYAFILSQVGVYSFLTLTYSSNKP